MPARNRFGLFRVAKTRHFAEANRRTVSRVKALGIEDKGETLLVGDVDFNLALCAVADVPYGDVVPFRLALKYLECDGLPSAALIAGMFGMPLAHMQRIYSAAGFPARGFPGRTSGRLK